MDTDRAKNFDEFEKMVYTKPTTKKEGDLFENFAKYYFTMFKKFDKYFTLREWFLADENLQNRLENLPLTDKGIDAIGVRGEKLFAIQIKFRKNRETISFGEVSTFIALGGKVVKGFDGIVFFTNCYDICTELKNSECETYTYSKFLDLDEKFWFGFKDDVIIPEPRIPKIPNEKQMEILELAKKYFLEQNRGKLLCACGTGKTLISFWICKNLIANTVLIFVPSLALMFQTYEAWAREFYSLDLQAEFKLIGSNSPKENSEKIPIDYTITTDTDEVKKFLETEYDGIVRKIVISTYHSSQVVKSACNSIHVKFNITIYDEAHRTVGPESDLFPKCVMYDISEYKLFMTATEKIIISRDTEKKVISMDNPTLFGNTIAQYSHRQAIQDGLLCDYNLICSIVQTKHIEQIIKENKYINVPDLGSVTARYLLIANMIVQNMRTPPAIGSFRHVILYANSKENAKKILDLINYVITIQNAKIYTVMITGDDSQTYRVRAMNKYQENEFAIISSVRVFNEGVNIEICDAVCFVDNKTSTVDIIQCFGRCSRLVRKCPKCKLNISECDCPTHQFYAEKIGNVIIPTLVEDNFFEGDEFKEIKRVLKTIAETDNIVAERLLVVNGEYLSVPDGGTGNKVEIGLDRNVDEIRDSLILRVFGKHGREIAAVRRRIISENMRRFQQSGFANLIDTCEKLQKYILEREKKEISIIYQKVDNWVEFCTGALFEKFRQHYYFNLNEIEKNMSALAFSSFDDYEKKRLVDPKFPSAELLINGIYAEFKQFNIIKLFVAKGDF